MYKLFYSPGSAALAPHLALEESGAKYEVIKIDLSKPRTKAHLAANPLGKVPAFVDGRKSFYESAAIAMYIADKEPKKKLAPKPGSTDRGAYYQWSVFLPGTLQSAAIGVFRARRANDPEAVKAAGETLDGVWKTVDDALKKTGPYLLGKAMSTPDLHLHMLSYWHPDRTALLKKFKAVAKNAALVGKRPAVKRVLKLHNMA